MTILCRIAAGGTIAGMLLGASGMGRGQQHGGGIGSTSATQTPAQTPSSQLPSVSPPVFDREDGPMDRARMEQEQAKSRNIERQKKIVDDTAKLLSLATELKTDVDKSDKNTLSLDVIKKADEIEKLAHNVKEHMKG